MFIAVAPKMMDDVFPLISRIGGREILNLIMRLS